MDDDSTSPRECFVEPQKGFWLRKRKRRISDAVSVCSLDISLASEPENKRKRGLSKVASLANLLSTPIRPVMKIGISLQRSLNGSRVNSPSSSPLSSSPYNFLQRSCSILRTPANNAQKAGTSPQARPRLIRNWSQMIAKNNTKGLSVREVKRQEAIYELWSGEDGIVEDLEIVQGMYQSALHFNLLSEVEAKSIFGKIENLRAIHCSLRDSLVELRDSVGITKSVGQTLLNWIPGLKCYIDYCSNQIWARVLLNEKKKNKRFQEFLKRCHESSSSRKLDLWTFLDVPRSRLMKYPLLVGEIQRHTPSNHEDTFHLTEIASALTLLLHEVDAATGVAEYKQMLTRLHFTHKDPNMHLVDKSTAIICSGELKDDTGTKLFCCLFDKCFVMAHISRPRMKFNVCHPVIPAGQLNVEEVDLLRRSTISQSSRKGRPAFRVGYNRSFGSFHTFVTSDEHVRKHWMDCIKQAVQLVSQQENIKPSEVTKKKSLGSSRRTTKTPGAEIDAQFTRQIRQRNRIGKSTLNGNLV